MADEDHQLVISYESLAKLRETQQQLLDLDWKNRVDGEDRDEESYLFQGFALMLDSYQEQPYLLDPFLEELITPSVDKLKEFARLSVANPDLKYDQWRANTISKIIYLYVKFRGYKTITRYFPHEVADLSIALDFIKQEKGLGRHSFLWATRYVTLLWLYIICIIPFDLVQFDEPENLGKTARDLEDISKEYLGTSGLEREAAALLLSRLYTRKDTGAGFHDFVVWAHSYLGGKGDLFMAIGMLQVICEVMKSGSAEQVHSESALLLSISQILQESSFTNNTVVRKYRTKLIARLALRLLPATTVKTRRQVRTLAGDASATGDSEIPEDIDVPPEVEEILGFLFEALQDRDTVVRWSAAKGVARIAERLPRDFCGQVLDMIIGLFEVHSVAAASLYDLPTVAEATWHGACLACAEMARRSLIDPEHLSQLIEWPSKALYFDLRKGAHSIGSNVRDAAAYVIWALARSQDQSSLVPHATSLAQKLATVAIFDREIHIRRAASAAFQEHVGRTNLFPHGIDVLGKTDFYAVSVRKNAFLIAAPQVAVHTEYRDCLLDHLLDVVLRHWDLPMRELGAQSLRLICALDLDVLAPRAIEKIVPLMESLDLTDVHGGLLALSEIAIAYKETITDPAQLEDYLRNVFKLLKNISEDSLTTTRNELVIAAACRLIANSITVAEIRLGDKSSVPRWRKIVDIGLKHRVSGTQESAAAAMGAMTLLTDCTADITRLIAELRRGTPTMQQSLALVLSVVNYNSHPKLLPLAAAYLLDTLSPTSKATIETRRSCLQALPCIVTLVSAQLTRFMSSELVNSFVNTLLAGLEDYSIDERGDVGSWARIASVQGLTTIAELLFQLSGSISNFASYLPPDKYLCIAAGLLKQGVERLDNVRQIAGVCFIKILNAPVPTVNDAHRWRLPALPLLHKLFLGPEQNTGWNEGTWLFPRAMRLLEIPEFRRPVLSGIVISVASKTDSTQKPIASSLTQFAGGLPLIGSASTAYSLLTLIDDLINHAKTHMSSNAVVVPVLQTFNILLEADVIRHVSDEEAGLQSLWTILNMASRNVEKLKSTQRIYESMKLIVNLLTFKPIRDKKASLLTSFLAHAFPKVRSDTAEYLYVVLQSADFDFETDAVEDILLETEWSAIDMESAKEAASQVAEAFMPSDA